MAIVQEVDPTFKQFFVAGNIWFWYTPLNPFRQFSNPFTGVKYTLMRVIYYFVLSSMILLIILSVVYLVDSLSSGGNFIQCCSVAVWFVCSLNAYQTSLFMWNRGPELVNLLEAIHDNFPKTDAAKERVDAKGIAKDFVDKSELLVRLYYVAFTGMCTAPLILTVIDYLTDGVIILGLPLVLWFPFDPLQMPWYPFVYILELWFFSLETYIIIANASLIGAITMVIGIQFKILALNLRTMEFCGDFQKDLGLIQDAIKQHNRVLYVAKSTRDLFSFQLLVAFTIASIVICIFMFLIIIEEEIVVSIILFLTLLCYLAYTGVYAFFGNELIENSMSIGDAVYHSNWTAADVQVQKLIILIIRRANEPEILTGMGFFVACFPTMSKILTTSYSYFTLLRTTYIQD